MWPVFVSVIFLSLSLTNKQSPIVPFKIYLASKIDQKVTVFALLIVLRDLFCYKMPYLQNVINSKYSFAFSLKSIYPVQET